MPKTTRVAASRAPTGASRLASLVAEFARGEGSSPSRLAGVDFMRSTRCHPRSAIAYEPGNPPTPAATSRRTLPARKGQPTFPVLCAAK